MSIEVLRIITIGSILAVTVMQAAHIDRHGEQLGAIEARLDKAGL